MAFGQGASEMVLKVCESVVDSSGGPVQLSDQLRKDLEEAVTQMACKGLRTLCLAVRDFPPDRPEGFFDEPPAEELTLCCLVGIKVAFAFQGPFSGKQHVEEVRNKSINFPLRTTDPQISPHSHTNVPF